MPQGMEICLWYKMSTKMIYQGWGSTNRKLTVSKWCFLIVGNQTPKYPAYLTFSRIPPIYSTESVPVVSSVFMCSLASCAVPWLIICRLHPLPKLLSLFPEASFLDSSRVWLYFFLFSFLSPWSWTRRSYKSPEGNKKRNPWNKTRKPTSLRTCTSL